MTSDYERIAKAIHYLETNFQRQPSLEDLAAYLHLSPYHLQRLFKRWAGISPKRFTQFLTAGYARQLLAESHDILETAYAAGLSGPGRLHDLLVNVDAMTPGEVKGGGAGLEIAFGFHDTPFGECLLALTDRGVCWLSFVEAGQRPQAESALHQQWPQASLRQQPERTGPVVRRIFERTYASAEPITLLLQGTNFQIKVWEALLNIPSGHAVSYEDVAGMIGQPRATRAAASAIARNHIAYLIPCHRVLRKNGDAGQYRWAATRKKAILGWEAAQRSDVAA